MQTPYRRLKAHLLLWVCISFPYIFGDSFIITVTTQYLGTLPEATQGFRPQTHSNGYSYKSAPPIKSYSPPLTLLLRILKLASTQLLHFLGV